MQKFTLYNYFRSSTSYRVRIALELKKIPYHYEPVHLLNNGGEQNSEKYRALNAMGGVPTLVHEADNGQKIILGQTMAILEYLDEASPQTHRLFPKDLQMKSLVRQFCENINADTHPYGNLKTLQYLEKNFNIQEDQKNAWIHHWTAAGLTACERLLQANVQNYQGPFCFGNTLTAADIFLVPQMVTAQRFKVPLEPFTHLNQVFENCMKQDAFIRAHPFRQIDTPNELRLK